jgi:ATP-dependent Clp protease ATP-binding subunit ClpA
MTFLELQNKTSTFFPIILTEKYIPHQVRKKIRFWSMILVFIFLILMIISSSQSIGSLLGISSHVFVFRGALFLFLDIWLIFYLLDLMFFSFYFRENPPMDFEVAEIVYKTNLKDVTKGFIDSKSGANLMTRLGISKKDIEDFLKNRKNTVTTSEYYVIENDDDPYVTLSEYIRSIIHFDIEFLKFLERNNVNAEIFKEATNWVARNQRRIRDSESWWKKENLQRVPSFGKKWAHSQTEYLESISHPVFEEISYRNIEKKIRLYENEVKQIEKIFLDEMGANIIIVGEKNYEALDVVLSFGKEIEKGTVNFDLEEKRIFILDSVGLNNLINNEDKEYVKEKLKTIFQQATKAGNIILIILDLPSLVINAHSKGIEIADLFKVTLDSPKLNIIAISDNKGFHETVETDFDLMKHFKKIMLPKYGSDNFFCFLENEISSIEKDYKVIFTFQAIKFLTDNAKSNEVINIINRVAKFISSKKDRALIKKIDVEKFIT